MSVHQLVPELAERIRWVSRGLFVDAAVGAETVRLQRVEPTPHRGLGHVCSPGALLGWTVLAYECAPEAWLLSIPGATFDLGTGLSQQAENLVPEAIAQVEAWLNEHPQPVAVTNEEEA
jgi:Ni,Fe-hydrogenase maturation factor